MNANFMPQRTGYSPPPFVRTNRPTATGNHNLTSTDLGVVLTAPNAICFLPVYDSSQDGKEYGITNQSTGVVTVQTSPGESIIQLQQPFSSVTIPWGESRQLARISNTTNWVIV